MVSVSAITVSPPDLPPAAGGLQAIRAISIGRRLEHATGP